jgi:hypothetical protein
MKYQAIPFSELKKHYTEVKNFLEKESGCDLCSLNYKITNNLRLAGDDVEDLLVKFVKKYNLQWGDFDFSKHFYSEGELFGSGPGMYNIVVFVINAFLVLIKLVNFNCVLVNLISFYRPLNREATDLSFREILTWYIEGEFKEDNKVIYQLAVN